MTFFLAIVASRATGETDVTPSAPWEDHPARLRRTRAGEHHDELDDGVDHCGAAASSADLLSDLKSGYLLGANRASSSSRSSWVR